MQSSMLGSSTSIPGLAAAVRDGGVLENIANLLDAAREAGAFSGPRALRTSGVRELRHAQAFHGSVAGTELSQKPPGFAALLAETRRQRGLGDFYQHMLVAEGCGELALDPELNPWDAAALQVIVEEAGGRATSLEGERSIYAGSLISTNGILHDKVLARLAASA